MNMFSEYTRTASELTELIERLKSDIIPTVEDYKLALSCIDLTTLNGNDTHEKVEALCKQAIDFYQPEKGLPGVAAVCVYPTFVRTAKRVLKETDIHVAAVAGAFPSGQSPLFVKLAEVAFTVEEGADEMIGIFIGDRRIGTVAKFVSERPARRWTAWAMRHDPNEELRAQFPTRKAAIEWLEKMDRERGTSK